MPGYTAVFDVGKTNKKLAVFDEALSLVEVRSARLPAAVEEIPRDRHRRSDPGDSAGPDERGGPDRRPGSADPGDSAGPDEGGGADRRPDPADRIGRGTVEVEVEPLGEIEAWFFATLGDLALRYDIEAIAVATHGGTYVCLDERDRLACPVISYTHEPGGSFHEEFYEFAGPRHELHRATATPPFDAFVNQAKSLYYVRTRFAERFARTRTILNYPQYFSFLLSGARTVDLSYLGCHTYLWDFHSWDWSGVAERLGVRRRYPQTFSKSYARVGSILPAVAERTGLSPGTVVACGAHDSNASLLPFLLQEKGDFLVLSTGTWCVAMRPAENVRISREDEVNLVLYNISVYGRPVRTAVSMAGRDYAVVLEALDTIAPSSDAAQLPDAGSYRAVVAERSLFILPRGESMVAVAGGETTAIERTEAGGHVPAFLKSRATAIAVLNLGTAIRVADTCRRAGLSGGTSVYVEGGFKGNRDFCALLASLLPGCRVYVSDLDEATTVGGSMLARSALYEQGPREAFPEFSCARTLVAPIALQGLDAYEEKHSAIRKQYTARERH